jgi:Ca-activated chloride channel homolog
MDAFRFAEPLFILLALAAPAAALLRVWRGRAEAVVVPHAARWAPRGLRAPQSRTWALYTAIILLSLAAARPQVLEIRREAVARGYDLMLAIDLSTSMLAEDYERDGEAINRLEAVRPVIQAFITGRPGDRIGVVVFAGRAFTLAPPTTDHRWLERRVGDISIGMVEDGTAIGDAMGLSLANLERARGGEDSTGAFIVLLTDGANTSGALSPAGAAALAAHRSVPVFAVAAGGTGMAPFPVFDEQGRRVGTRPRPFSIEPEALNAIAETTGGRFFMADDQAALQEAFTEIDASQAAEYTVRARLAATSLHAWLAVPAFALLLWSIAPGALLSRRERAA